MIDVAIIEDDVSARGILVDWVRHANDFRCVTGCGSAESALKDLPALKPGVVLVDINLPDMNGTECVRRLKVLLPKTQFVMLTVYEDTNHIFDALAAGASGYLLKETPLDEVLAAVKNVHEGGSPMSSHIARKVVQFFQRRHLPSHENEKLSPREVEVLNLLAQGYLYKEIAEVPEYHPAHGEYAYLPYLRKTTRLLTEPGGGEIYKYPRSPFDPRLKYLNGIIPLKQTLIVYRQKQMI